MTAPLPPLDGRCKAVSDDGYRCILTTGHGLSHQRYPCIGICDICDCDFDISYWEDDFELFDDDEAESR